MHSLDSGTLASLPGRYLVPYTDAGESMDTIVLGLAGGLEDSDIITSILLVSMCTRRYLSLLLHLLLTTTGLSICLAFALNQVK